MRNWMCQDRIMRRINGPTALFRRGPTVATIPQIEKNQTTLMKLSNPETLSITDILSSSCFTSPSTANNSAKMTDLRPVTLAASRRTDGEHQIAEHCPASFPRRNDWCKPLG